MKQSRVIERESLTFMDIKERDEERGVSRNAEKVGGECSLLNTLCFSFFLL